MLVLLKNTTLCNNYNIFVIFAKRKPTFTPFTYVKSSVFELIFILSYARKGHCYSFKGHSFRSVCLFQQKHYIYTVILTVLICSIPLLHSQVCLSLCLDVSQSWLSFCFLTHPELESKLFIRRLSLCLICVCTAVFEIMSVDFRVYRDAAEDLRSITSPRMLLSEDSPPFNLHCMHRIQYILANIYYICKAIPCRMQYCKFILLSATMVSGIA